MKECFVSLLRQLWQIVWHFIVSSNGANLDLYFAMLEENEWGMLYSQQPPVCNYLLLECVKMRTWHDIRMLSELLRGSVCYDCEGGVIRGRIYCQFVLFVMNVGMNERTSMIDLKTPAVTRCDCVADCWWRLIDQNFYQTHQTVLIKQLYYVTSGQRDVFWFLN